MLRFGESLYRLTDRDYQTLQVDPFARAATGTVAALATTAQVDILFPADRAIYLNRILLLMSGIALSQWTVADVVLIRENSVSGPSIASFGDGPLSGDGTTVPAAAGAACRINVPIDYVVPPNTAGIRMVVQRNNTTNAGLFYLSILGYLIPPGRIGRL